MSNQLDSTTIEPTLLVSTSESIKSPTLEEIANIIANLTIAQENSLSQIMTRLSEDAAKSDSQIELLKEEIRTHNENYIKLLELENEKSQNETENILQKTSEIITKSNQDLFYATKDFNSNLSHEIIKNITQEVNQLIIEMRRQFKHRISLMELKLENIIRVSIHQKNKSSQHDQDKRKSNVCSKRANK